MSGLFLSGSTGQGHQLDTGFAGSVELVLNAEPGGLSPAELKFGTQDYQRFQLPQPLPPGHSYHELVAQLDHNLATVRSITSDFQMSLRTDRKSVV